MQEVIDSKVPHLVLILATQICLVLHLLPVIAWQTNPVEATWMDNSYTLHSLSLAPPTCYTRILSGKAPYK
jgi:hypothetical protein